MKKLFYLIPVILFGIFMIVFGEKDDSPGAQMLGLVVAITGVVGLIKVHKKF